MPATEADARHILIPRIVKKIDFRNCWTWTAACIKVHSKRSGGGYGIIKIDGNVHVAHRVVYEALKGPIPLGYQLDHLCGVKSCVNPEHLEPVTPQENSRRYTASIDTGHCRNGHLYDEENTRWQPVTRRGKTTLQKFCKACHKEHVRRHHARKAS